MEGEHAHARTFDPETKVREVLDARDRMAVARRGHAIDQIDEAVLHATHQEMVDDMQNERRRRVVHEGRRFLREMEGGLGEYRQGPRGCSQSRNALWIERDRDRHRMGAPPGRTWR